MQSSSGSYLRHAVLIFLLVLLVLTGTGQTDKLLGHCGLNQLSTANRVYLEDSYNRSLKLFAVLSTIKVFLAVVEGSEVGVGFGLEIGDLVQAAYDHVNVAWKTVLAAAVILKCMQYFLDTAAYLDQWFLFLALLFVTSMLTFRWYMPERSRPRRLARDGGLFLTVLTVALYLSLPLAIAGGRQLSKRITEPSLSQAEQGITQFKRDLNEVNQTDENLLTGLKQRIDEMGRFIKEQASDLVTYLFTIIATYLFDCIVFPLSLFIFLLWSTRLGGHYFFSAKKTQNFKDDLDDMMARYLGSGRETKSDV